jgi:hypothetical protein
MKGIKIMNARTSVKELYMPFLRKCWREGLTDTLISTVVPFDNSTITSYRNEEKYKSTAKTLKKEHLDKLFEILKEFPWIIESANPLRTVNNVAFWKRHEDLFQYFMQLRDRMLNSEEPTAENNVILSYEDVVEDKPTECEAVSSETAHECHCEQCKCDSTEPSTKLYIKQQLKAIAINAVNSELYEIATDIIAVLETDF